MLVEENFEYFDDCPICQAMKRLGLQGEITNLDELTPSQEFELIKAFKKAKELGHKVGGEWVKYQT